MFLNKLPTKFLLTAAVIKAAEDEKSPTAPIVCKASELPIYEHQEEHDEKAEPVTVSEEVCRPPDPNILESAVTTVRKRVWIMHDYYRLYKSEAEDILEGSANYAKSAYNYLSKECDDTTRVGAVGLGAATGFILGLRGGIIRKLFYASVTGVGMAAICYPDLTEEYSQEIITNSRKYSIIAYNFVMGVKKDDIPMPEFPKLGDIWGKAGEMGKSATSLITGGSEAENVEPSPDKVQAQEQNKQPEQTPPAASQTNQTTESITAH